jgi:hypothetical protein
MNAEEFIDFMAKRAREIIEENMLPTIYFEKIEAWKEVENWISTYKKGEF